MEQRHHDIFLALAAAVGAGRGLERMLQPVDREAAIIAVEQLQMGEHAVGQPAAMAEELRADDRPVLLGAFIHAAEGRAAMRFVHLSNLRRSASPFARASQWRSSRPISALMATDSAAFERQQRPARRAVPR